MADGHDLGDLSARDRLIIETCAQVCEKLFRGFSRPWEYEDDCAQQIRALLWGEHDSH